MVLETSIFFRTAQFNVAQCSKNCGSTAFERKQNPEWKVKYGGNDDLKEMVPNLNTPQYSRLLSRRFSLKRPCAKRRFLFCCHKMVKHRNEYVSECYRQNKVHDCQTCRPVADGAPRRTREKTYGTQGIRRKHEQKFSLKQMLGSKMF